MTATRSEAGQSLRAPRRALRFALAVEAGSDPGGTFSEPCEKCEVLTLEINDAPPSSSSFSSSSSSSSTSSTMPPKLLLLTSPRAALFRPVPPSDRIDEETAVKSDCA